MTQKPKPYAWLCEREKCVLHPRIFYSKEQAETWAETITVNPPVKIIPVYTRRSGAHP